MSRVEISQGSIEYRAAGPADSTAPAVVFVHGLLVNNELWTAVADDLAARGIRSYAPQLPLGSHPVPLNADADRSPRGVATLINDFLAALDLTDVTLVGNDTGGALCQFLIDSDHSRIGRLVLTNCDAFDTFPPEPFHTLFTLARRPAGVRALLTSIRPKVLRHSVLGFGGLVATPLDKDLSRRWITPGLADRGVRADVATFIANIRPKELLDVATRLHDFPKPVLLVWGSADRFFTIDMARRLQAAFADATLVEIDGGRTFVSLDHPHRVADEVAAAFYPASQGATDAME